MTSRRIGALGLAGLVLVAVVLQVSVLSQVSVRGVVPDLALILVVAVALGRGARSGAVVGFWSGLLVDVAPPADHAAGAWALVLLLVGALAGRAATRPGWREDDLVRPVLLTGALSLGAHVLFAVLTLLPGGVRDGSVLGFGDGIGTLAQIVLLATVVDVVVAALVLGPLTRVVRWIPGGALGPDPLEAGQHAGPDPHETVVVRTTDQSTGQMVGLSRGETWQRS